MKTIIIAMLCLFSINIIAQNMEVDAIKFGTNNNDGSARHIAVGGAMSAIGGDISNISYNPASIAIYKSSVIMLSPSFEINKSNIVFGESSSQRIKNNFNISNLGIVFSMKNKKFSPVRSINLALAMNNLNSYNVKNSFSQYNTNSITSNWVNEAISVNGNQENSFDYDNFSFETVGAYNTWLVNFDTSSNTYTSPISNKVLQSRITTTKGNKRDFALSMGANVLDKIYLATTVSIPHLEYESTSNFKEEDTKNLNGNFNEFSLAQEYKTSGTGVSVKIGAIYKPIHFLRLSAAIQSQTRYTLNEEYTSNFNTVFDTATFVHESSIGKFKYDLVTPWRANAGLALVSKKLGFVSFDYELVDYASTKYKFEDAHIAFEDNLNKKFKTKYQIAHNFKVGVEAKIKKFRIRGGYNMQTSPLKNSFREGKHDFSRQQFSGGLGYLWKKVSIDASYRYSMSNEYELSYDGTNGITKNNDTQLFLVTVGFKISK